MELNKGGSEEQQAHDSKCFIVMAPVKMGIKEEEQQCVEEKMHLSSDSIYEILTRVSNDTLFRSCPWVCKDWKKLVYDTNFRLTHLEKIRTISGYFIQSLERSRYRSSFISIIDNPRVPSPSLDFLPSTHVKIEASSPYGLLCCTGNPTSQNPIYYICKPTTREWVKIPKPSTHYRTVNMALMVKQSYPNLSYKVIRISNLLYVSGYRCEIFDSNYNSWKRMEDIRLSYDVILDHRCGVLVNGELHLLTNDGRIFVFNVNQENWTTIELPQEQEEMNYHKKLVDCEGKLAVIYSHNWKMELWVLEERSRNLIWKKKFNVDLKSLSRDTEYISLLDMYTPDTALMSFYDKIALYNCSRGQYITSKHLPRISSVGQVFTFHSDSAPCGLSGGWC